MASESAPGSALGQQARESLAVETEREWELQESGSQKLASTARTFERGVILSRECDHINTAFFMKTTISPKLLSLTQFWRKHSKAGILTYLYWKFHRIWSRFEQTAAGSILRFSTSINWIYVESFRRSTYKNGNILKQFSDFEDP